MKFLRTLSVWALFFSIPSFAEEVSINDASLVLSEKWSLEKHEDTGAAYLTRYDKNAQLVVYAKYVQGSTQNLSLFLETYEARGLPISSVQVGRFSGYFIPFELEDGCHANWLLLDGDYFLSAGYKGDCDTVDYAPVLEMIRSVRAKPQ